MRRVRSVLLLGLACAGAATAQTSVEVAHGIENLSNGSRDWRESVVTVRHAFGPTPRSPSLALGLTRTERFGLSDDQVAISGVTPLSADVTASVDASRSTTHRILPESTLGAVLQYEFAKAWLLHGGARTTRYEEARINQGLLMLEHYTGPFSWAVGMRRARAFDTSTSSGELRGSYYYGDRHSIGVIVAAGREAANIGGIVTLTSQRSAVLVGRYWLRPNLALAYSLGHTREGDYYNRNGASLGIQATF
jgi:YaiO family outer membrane protein